MRPAVGISFVLPRKNKTKNYFRPGRKRVDLVLFFCAPFRGAEKSKLIRVRPSEKSRLSGRGATGRPPEPGKNGSGRAGWDVTSLRGHGSSPPPLEGRAREGAQLQGRLSFRRRNFSRRPEMPAKSKEFTYATVCSGIECMSAAVAPLGGWKPVFFSEIEPFPCSLLKHRYPTVPNLGDMTKITAERIGDEEKWRITNGTDVIELAGRLGCLAGGTPCQDVSVAGKRAGMAEGSGTRSSLAFHFARLCRELQPRWVVWENVSGERAGSSHQQRRARLRALRPLDWGMRVFSCLQDSGRSMGASGRAAPRSSATTQACVACRTSWRQLANTCGNTV